MTDANILPGCGGMVDQKVETVDDLPFDPRGIDRVVLEHYDREQIPLRRYLVFLGVRDATAQEIVQESFLRLFRHLGQNGARGNLRAWIYRVAHNLARNEQTASRERQCDSLAAEHTDALAEIGGESPERLLLNREKQERLYTAIQNLPEAQRACLVLRAQGMKYREIASVLDISISNVGENVQRGLSRLRELL